MKQVLNSEMLFGQVLPNLPPRPNMARFDALNFASESLATHNASNAPISQAATATPSTSHVPNRPVLTVPEARIGAENFNPTFATNHSVHENFGGSPRWEATQMGFLPQNPRAMTNAPTVNVDFGPKHIPIRENPIIPKANLPAVPNLNGRISKAAPISLELKAVTPTLKANDLGGLTSSMSRFGGIGQSSGRSFGSDSFMTGF